MGTKTYTGHFEGDGNARNIDCGYIPQYVILYQDVAKTSPDKIEWFERFVDDSSMYGLQTTGSTGVVTRLTTAATGISEYSENSVGVLIESPQDSGKQVFASVADWAAATDYSSAGSARTATAIGTIVRPPDHINRVFELTTATGAGTSEPATWDVQPGETVTDGGSNVWTCRDENVTKGDFYGFTVGATAQTDAKEYYFIAVGSDKDQDKGDESGA